MVLASKKSYAYWKIEDSWAYDQAMGANGAGNYHLPFNPLLKFNPPLLKYKEEEIVFFSDEEASLVYTELRENEETENESIYRGPLLLVHLFPHVVEPGAWSQTGTNVITADFSTQSWVNSMAVHLHLHDQDEGAGNDLERTYKGTRITTYGWKCDRGKLIKEFWKWKAATLVEESQAPDMDAGLDDTKFNRTGIDGGFDVSSQQGPYHASDVTLTKGGVAIVGLEIEKFTLTINLPDEFIHIYSSRDPQVRYQGIKGFMLTAEGTMSNYTQQTEIEKLHKNKTLDTLQFLLEANNWLQFTNSYVSKFNFDGIPEAGKPSKFDIEIKGGGSTALDFKWTNTAGPVLDLRTYIN